MILFTTFEAGRVALRSARYSSIILALSMVFAFQARAAEVQDIVIHNVHIVNSGGQTGADLASLRIIDGNLDLVSADQIVVANGTPVFDANGGYLLGNLIIGEPPKFMVLSKDPVSNLKVLIDTKPYVVFAVEDGQLLINDLQADSGGAPDTEYIGGGQCDLSKR